MKTIKILGHDVDVKNNVIVELKQKVNSNEVYIEWNGLKATFRIILKEEPNRVESIRVTNDVLEYLGCTVDELYKVALANTMKKRPAVVGYFGPMPILTNKSGMCGATVIMYDGIRDLIDQFTEGDCFLIPSSIHEWILFPDNGYMTVDDVRAMVRDVNNTEVDPKERLSYDVYLYKKGQVEVV